MKPAVKREARDGCNSIFPREGGAVN